MAPAFFPQPKLQTPLFIAHLGTFRMVNFHDPAQLARNFGANDFLSRFCSQKEGSLGPSLDSTSQGRRGDHDWSLHVGRHSSASLNESLTLCVQMGVRHYSRLRVGCHPRASAIQMDDMGL